MIVPFFSLFGEGRSTFSMNSEYREAHYGKYLRTRSRMSRIDLNVVSIFNQEPEETSVNSSRQIEPMSNQGGNRPPTIIDIEAISDDVIILSPRSFAEVCFFSSLNFAAFFFPQIVSFILYDFII
ncbi:hypothetical protein LIER_44146 [Lithospermum erythrorhizon]|uniref:Uncharacterized protein n=1 Tax=Lithospermum erythrorhizon TaxID=34254 RepID=A0AAV3QHX5_LITER